MTCACYVMMFRDVSVSCPIAEELSWRGAEVVRQLVNEVSSRVVSELSPVAK